MHLKHGNYQGLCSKTEFFIKISNTIKYLEIIDVKRRPKILLKGTVLNFKTTFFKIFMLIKY